MKHAYHVWERTNAEQFGRRLVYLSSFGWTVFVVRSNAVALAFVYPRSVNLDATSSGID